MLPTGYFEKCEDFKLEDTDTLIYTEDQCYSLLTDKHISHGWDLIRQSKEENVLIFFIVGLIKG